MPPASPYLATDFRRAAFSISATTSCSKSRPTLMFRWKASFCAWAFAFAFIRRFRGWGLINLVGLAIGFLLI